MALIQGIISILPTLVAAAITLILTLVNALIGALPQIISRRQIANGFDPRDYFNLPQLVTAAITPLPL